MSSVKTRKIHTLWSKVIFIFQENIYTRNFIFYEAKAFVLQNYSSYHVWRLLHNWEWQIIKVRKVIKGYLVLLPRLVRLTVQTLLAKDYKKDWWSCIHTKYFPNKYIIFPMVSFCKCIQYNYNHTRNNWVISLFFVVIIRQRVWR